MELTNLSLSEVSHRSGVGYATCSQILRGRLVHPSYLARIRSAIKAAPQPAEALI